MKADYFSLGCITAVTYAERRTCCGAGYVRDQRSAGINALATNQSDQSVLLENVIIIYKRSREARCLDHQRVSEGKTDKPLQIDLTICIRMIDLQACKEGHSLEQC